VTYHLNHFTVFFLHKSCGNIRFRIKTIFSRIRKNRESTKWLKWTVWQIILYFFSFMNDVVTSDIGLRPFFTNPRNFLSSWIAKVIEISRIGEKWPQSQIWCYLVIYEGKTLWKDVSHGTFQSLCRFLYMYIYNSCNSVYWQVSTPPSLINIQGV
jgi:hypothetical protein